VPVYYNRIPGGMDSAVSLCAVVATNKQSFTLYQNHSIVGSYQLPVYNDGKGRAAKIALTPVAVGADLTIVGGYVAYLYFSSGGYYSTGVK
jgi:hypothetical protein